ncbi:MAG: hypothetical protein ACTHZE_12775, partial [Brevibacterium aurantiacum]
GADAISCDLLLSEAVSRVQTWSDAACHMDTIGYTERFVCDSVRLSPMMCGSAEHPPMVRF